MLDYAKWENFYKVIKRAMIACENSGRSVSDDFPEVGKIVEAGATRKTITDYELSRYACYLIVQNGDPRKEVIALGQTYFAIQTYRQEVADRFNQLDEDSRRLVVAVISSSGISFWLRPHGTQALSRRKNLQSFRMLDIWACMAE